MALWFIFFGGGKRDRTADLLNAIQALSQLSYTPTITMQLPNKPSSVTRFRGGNHLSTMPVTWHLQRPTREKDGRSCFPPIWSCSGWGLPSRTVTRSLVRSYRTVSALPMTGLPVISVFFSVALSLGSPPPGVTRHPALRSSDFPRTAETARDYLRQLQKPTLMSARSIIPRFKTVGQWKTMLYSFFSAVDRLIGKLIGNLVTAARNMGIGHFIQLGCQLPGLFV